MVLKQFILPVKHFKANLFFPIMTPLTHPITHPQEYRAGDTKRCEGGLIKVKKHVDFKINFRWFKAFFCFFSIKGAGAGWVGPDPERKIPLSIYFFETVPKEIWLFWLKTKTKSKILIDNFVVFSLGHVLENTSFQTPSVLLEPPVSHFRFCNLCTIAGGEWVPPVPLDWWFFMIIG